MLRVKTRGGWWLITHPDHARLAATLASHWGNSTFVSPSPPSEVLEAIRVHDDGWALRDAHPRITQQGKPSAFSIDLVGKYSAFEEIDLADYLSVRGSAVSQVEARCSYAALLVSMHTYNLLTERADRSTIAAEQLPLLDAFLMGELARQKMLRGKITSDRQLSPEQISDNGIQSNFHLLQAMDNLSLLGCVRYMEPATLLHPLAVCGGGFSTVDVLPMAPGLFRLSPYPFDQPLLTVGVASRHIEGVTFATDEELGSKFAGAPVEELTITLTG